MTCRPSCGKPFKPLEERGENMKILVGYDGSNSAKDALRLALSHASRFDASVEVATSMVQGRENERSDIQQAESGLNWAEEKAREAGIACATHLLIRGMSVGEDLITFAGEKGFDLIYIGVRRRSRVGKLLMGSSAQYVILKAPCPVMTVK